MIDGIWHLRGSVSFDAAENDAVVLARLETLLKKQRKPISSRGTSGLVFDSPIWSNMFASNWLAMIVYDRGSFQIDRNAASSARLEYDLRSLHGFIFCLFGAAMFFTAGSAGGNLSRGIMLAVFAFCWLYGMNMLLAWVRIPRLIRKTILHP
jgi:hypothetical protein